MDLSSSPPAATSPAATSATASNATLTDAPKKKAAARCAFGSCTERPVKIVGDCRYCTSKFCARHRLPEAHACGGMAACRDEAASKLSARVLGEKTVAQKV
jgi:predicted nucleic acid binding AN1-type Zn finger protein